MIRMRARLVFSLYIYIFLNCEPGQKEAMRIINLDWAPVLARPFNMLPIGPFVLTSHLFLSVTRDPANIII